MKFITPGVYWNVLNHPDYSFFSEFFASLLVELRVFSIPQTAFATSSIFATNGFVE
ncbi:hypothetical protein [Klebsiella pneumoniae]|uniref:hypothetical protein n=1 Tax=Klebsiella pneumoniae TaxID=573 RepID=UPI00178C7DE9|nr:hypothetical protein [Klebsiella pneumoniae]